MPVTPGHTAAALIAELAKIIPADRLGEAVRYCGEFGYMPNQAGESRQLILLEEPDLLDDLVSLFRIEDIREKIRAKAEKRPLTRQDCIEIEVDILRPASIERNLVAGLVGPTRLC